MDTERRYLRPKEAARLTGLSERTIRRLLADGRLEAAKVGAGRSGARLIPLAALERLLEAEGHRD